MQTPPTTLFDFHGRPGIARALPISLQHVLAMIAGVITPPLIVAGVVGATPAEKLQLIQVAVLASGVCTLFHLYGVWKFGARLPAIFGVGFAYVPTLIAVGAQYGIEGILGAQLIGGITMMVVGYFIQFIRHLFPPVVAGTVVLVIGLSLYDIAIRYMAGSGNVNAEGFGDLVNWGLGVLTLVTVLVASQFGRGVVKLSAIIIGMLVGYLVAIPLGMIDFSPVNNAPWLAVPELMPFEMEFHSAAIISMVVICVINSVQTIGDLSATSVAGMNRELATKELTGGLLGNGLTTTLSTFFGALPTSTYSQNVGIVAITKVISRSVFMLAGVIVLLAGLSPKFGALMTTIPYPVIGGATITVFGMITVTGIQLLIKDEMTARNMTIVGLSLALSLGITSVPSAIEQFPETVKDVVTGAPIVIAAISAFLLNLLLPRKTLAQEAQEREEEARQTNLDRQSTEEG
ncbi:MULTISPECIES: nucleobase:cation symporter-2 family protein [Halomonas]|mgnify:CR=1 FL=1|uniref:Purine permease n=2 Tax=Halomonas TaxID=2745 RepID=A0AAU7KMP0_9GAMM|nr:MULTISPECIES: nucleobase:cation symporter-2 family protein [Halomonas]MBR9770768.1 purine permease [Gammaproteobacteria bacterium]MAR70972.1 uracil permease [Halomonas sp.]MBY6111934.1 purine permease [Halomonas sp. DP1Y21-3]MCO7215148.1 purine permease [Halomonas sp. OfavH-34-E]PTL89618.1 uracil permease [Halomonas sp. SYSU XM8]